MAYALLGASTSVPTVAHRPALTGRVVTQITIRQRLIVRVPPIGPLFQSRALRLKEKRGPRCLTLAGLAGAAITESDSVDFLMRGGDRIRARLDRTCPALDYYSGFYLPMTKDGQVCSGRDTLKTRMGGECAIDKFKTMVVKR